MSTTLEQFAEEMKKLLALKEIDVDAPMSQLGVDSMNIDENTTIRELDEQMHALELG